MSAVHIITPEDLRRGCDAFERHEGRDSMYRVAVFLIDQWWGQPAEMVDALTVLLLTRNGAFYRYAMFTQSRLEACVRDQWAIINAFHNREIASLTESDHEPLASLFLALLDALRRPDGARSPVGVAKTLHLLAPRFLPIWDERIAGAYGYGYKSNPINAYLRFCDIIRTMAATLKPAVPVSSKTLLKQIDEFNYAKYTKAWI